MAQDDACCRSGRRQDDRKWHRNGRGPVLAVSGGAVGPGAKFFVEDPETQLLTGLNFVCALCLPQDQVAALGLDVWVSRTGCSLRCPIVCHRPEQHESSVTFRPPACVPTSRVIASSRSCRSNGLERWPSMPAARHSAISSRCALAVSARMGVRTAPADASRARMCPGGFKPVHHRHLNIHDDHVRH